MVRRAAADGLLQADQGRAAGRSALCRADQGDDREEPSFGYRTVAWLLGFNKNTVQRIFQIKGWQVRRRPIGMRPRIEAVPSVATAPNERWSTDLCRVWAGRDGWTTLALVIDCHTRELLGWHLSVTIRRRPWRVGFLRAWLWVWSAWEPISLRADQGVRQSCRSGHLRDRRVCLTSEPCHLAARVPDR